MGRKTQNHYKTTEWVVLPATGQTTLLRGDTPLLERAKSNENTNTALYVVMVKFHYTSDQGLF